MTCCSFIQRIYQEGLRDKSLTDLDSLPEPDELAEENIDNMDAGLESFQAALAKL